MKIDINKLIKCWVRIDGGKWKPRWSTEAMIAKFKAINTVDHTTLPSEVAINRIWTKWDMFATCSPYVNKVMNPFEPTPEPAKVAAKRTHCGFNLEGKHYDSQGIDGMDATRYDQGTAEMVARRDALTSDIRVRRRDVLRLAKWADETKGWK